MLFFMACSQELRSALRLGVEGLDVPLGFIPNLIQYDSNVALAGCGICTVAMTSRAVLPALSNSSKLKEIMKPKSMMKIAGISALPFALFPIIAYMEMVPLFQYSFVLGCLVNNVYMATMDNNLLGLAKR